MTSANSCVQEFGQASARAETFFLKVRGSPRFCILQSPAEDVVFRGAIVHSHAFAEEMNKSRRMVARAARALAAAGWAVLLIDLEGCGDSAADIGTATWQGWIDDVLFAHRWLSERFNCASFLWGLRAGCLIAARAAQ